jgi:hypothetical protein
MQQKIYKKGMDISTILYGLLAIAIGIAVFVFVVAGNYTITLYRIAIPTWVIAVVGVIICLVGIILIVIGFSSQLCAECGGSIEFSELNFSLKQNDTVVKAAQQFDASLLQPDFVPELNENITLNIRYCKKCRQIGEIEVEKTAEFHESTTNLVPNTVVPKDKMKAFADFAETHGSEDEG